ncbi:MAG: hypothetical protein WBC85_12355 [Planktotalea sp.]|uniref:hypothetical protein n=1 Tax=Planktotalea sp. TaxID=2029877 RepID=UPI003C793952
MKNLIKSFAKREGGAVTTEFLVLVAAVVGFGVIGYAGMNSGPEKVVNVDPDVALNNFVAGF